ncbi:Secretory lipase [Nocardia amikacinitolerans]|uniref:Secretory lipase n=2 Tax=Nocardia amikacinitolerans TaxID=756689 RepID=A0A285KWH5_9NOCA|nr:Secretory lipase [Nocardia amikacinitolerans]MCP2294204.1 Secretory lipase [Nocardia amikacinitolerans]SNY76593.1 Secretory lipase [Nocardia amikacinitolerans]
MTRRFSLLPGHGCNRVTHVLGTLGGMALGVLLATTATAGPLYPIPDPDPFYAAPANLAAHRPGDVLDVRGLPPLPLFPGATVRQVEFRSTDSHGNPIAATTTILTPLGNRPDAPLLSYQHFINSLGSHCAVSHRLYDHDVNLTLTMPILNVALQRGWSIALPDHLGPQFALGAARLGGQITLDGIRAVKRLPELGLANSPVGMVGYSGGGIATSWAAALQPTYAPELRLAGAAIGGVPMNLWTMAEALGYDPHPAFGLAMAVAIGLEREYPDRLPLGAHLNPRGLAVRDAMANSCTNELLAIGANTGARDYASNPFFDMPGDARAVVEENSLELYPGVPEIPMFEWHSPSDPLIPVGSIVNTDRRWCDAGVQLETLRVDVPEHLSAALAGAPQAMTWLNARIEGEPAPRNC